MQSMIFPTKRTHVVNSTRDVARPPITTPLVGVTRFTRPQAPEKIMIITSGLKPSFTARGPNTGNDPEANPEVEGIKKDNPM